MKACLFVALAMWVAGVLALDVRRGQGVPAVVKTGDTVQVFSLDSDVPDLVPDDGDDEDDEPGTPRPY